MVNLMTLERRGAIDFGSIFLLPFLDGYPIRGRTRVDFQKEKFYLEIIGTDLQKDQQLSQRNYYAISRWM